MKALVLADRVTQRQLQDFFLHREHEVQLAGTGEEARAACDGEDFQFVFLDLDGDGDAALDFCRWIRSREDHPQPHVLVFPAEETPKALRSAFAAGADDYLLKPVREDALKLRLAIGQRQLASQRQLSGRLDSSGRRYRTLVETMNEGLFQVNEQGVIEFANSRLSEITGYTLNELIGQKVDELLVADSVRERLPGQTLLGTGTGSEEYSIPLKTKSGDEVWVNLTAAPLPALGGDRPGSVGVVEDISRQRDAEEGLRHREEYFRILLERSSDLITILNLDGRVIYQNLTSEEILGWRAEELVGKDFSELVHEDDRAEFHDTVQAALEHSGATASVQLRFQNLAGDWLSLETLCNNLVDNPVVGGVVLTSRDMTDRRRAEAALKRQRAFFEQLFRNSPSGIVILDTADRVVDVNRAFIDLFQYEIEELEGKSLHEFIVPNDLDGEASELSDMVRQRQNIERESVRQRKDGTTVDVSILGYPIVLGDKPIGVFGLYSDITERKNAERQLFHDAFHDPLTGLPNRALLIERLERDLRRSKRRQDYQFALLFLDLDRFKAVNDELGHAVGDEFLKEAAARLQGCLRPGDTTARLGGDEFTVILEDIRGPFDGARVAHRILEALRQPYEFDGHQVESSGSIGIAFSATGYELVEDMIRDADMAMYRAKSRGRGRYEIFDQSLDLGEQESLEIDEDLDSTDQLMLSYQPIVSLSNGRVVGFEALVRWLHPDRGLLLPAELIPACEESGLIIQLGRRVLTQACRQVAGWAARFPDSDAVQVSVNLTLGELVHAQFGDHLDRVVRETGIHPASLSLEVTEDTINAATDGGGDRVMWDLGRRGFRWIVDDFGSGRTSLRTLHHLPFHRVKIDRAIVSSMRPGGSDVELLRAAAALGDSLGLGVVAKGVESRRQIATLRRLGVGFAQGFYFSSPLPAIEAEKLIAEDKRWNVEDEDETEASGEAAPAGDSIL